MLKLHDSVVRKPVAFKPLQKGKAAMYSCGPTVYDYVHIGNLRSFLLPDLLRRVLERRGLVVTQIMNITDVGHMLSDGDTGEDKMDVAAAKAGKTPQDIAEFYTDAFFKDIDRIGNLRAHAYPRATAHVPEMIAIIEKLLAAGCAYQVQEDGGTSVYFDVTKAPSYGKLSGNVVEALDAGARVEVREGKRHPADFALWIHNPKHLMQWEAPWGTGYPGWHIECSAMAIKYLGQTFDIHTAGEDNKFPHNECEIAQAECATGLPYARIWLHVTHLLVDDEKMSKSKGNFYTLDDLLAKGFDARAVRYLLLSAQYRQTLNFTLDGLRGAGAALGRIDACADTVRQSTPKQKGRVAGPLKVAAKKALAAFDAALDDDLNVPAALASVFEFVRQANEAAASGTITHAGREAALGVFDAVGLTLGFVFGRMESEDDVPPSVLALVEKRDEARKEKRFAEADRLRDELKEKGWMVEDGADGRRIRRV